MTQPVGFGDKVAFIWGVADLLRGDFKAHEYGQVILPFTVLRRLECALEPTKAKVLDRAKSMDGKPEFRELMQAWLTKKLYDGIRDVDRSARPAFRPPADSGGPWAKSSSRFS